MCSIPVLRRRRFLAAFAQFTRCDDGASMAEYALLVAVVALVAMGGAKLLGTTLNVGAGVAAARIANP